MRILGHKPCNSDPVEVVRGVLKSGEDITFRLPTHHKNRAQPVLRHLLLVSVGLIAMVADTIAMGFSSTHFMQATTLSDLVLWSPVSRAVFIMSVADSACIVWESVFHYCPSDKDHLLDQFIHEGNEGEPPIEVDWSRSALFVLEQGLTPVFVITPLLRASSQLDHVAVCGAPPLKWLTRVPYSPSGFLRGVVLQEILLATSTT